MLMDLEHEHPGVKNSMLKALQNVAPRHLLDTRLNPPAELRATVSLATSSDLSSESEREIRVPSAVPTASAPGRRFPLRPTS
jgi:hypothetical protein